MALIEPVEFISKKNKKISIRNLATSEALKLRDAAAVIAETSPFILSTSDDFRKKTEEDQVKFISSHNDADRNLLIVAESENQIVGILNFGSFRDEKRKHRGLLGISLHHDFRREGIAKKLFQVLLTFTQDDPHLRFMELDVMGCNQDAIELYKKVGFTFLHSTPQAYQLSDGSFADEVRMRMELKK